jgi:DNA-binding CsgD family transcriptional regulator
MASVKSESFTRALHNLLRARITFSTFLFLRFPTTGAPEPLSTWIRDPTLAHQYPRLYTEGAYRLDPFFQFTDFGAAGGMFRLSEIAPDRFFSGEYYLQYYRETKIIDEVGLLVPLSDGSTGHLSFSRREGVGAFRRKELKCLRHYTPILLELLRQHFEHRLSLQATQAPDPEQRPLDVLIRAHVQSVQNKSITKRESEIAGLILQGHSNLSAALVMGISRETAKVHRRNIYRKLRISSQTELFALLAELF